MSEAIALSGLNTMRASYYDHNYLEYRDLLDHQIGVEVPPLRVIANPKEESTLKKELFGIEKVIGKEAKDMTEDDALRAAIECPIKPLHTVEEVLEESYIRNLITYFPHATHKLIANHLLGIEKGECVGKFLKKIGLEHKGSREKIYLMEHVAFILWATDNTDEATKYRDEKLAEYDNKKYNLPNYSANKEEESMTKKTDTPVNLAETTVAKTVEEAPAPTTESTRRPSPEPTTEFKKADHAVIVLDTTSPDYGKAMAMLYENYAHLILSVKQ